MEVAHETTEDDAADTNFGPTTLVREALSIVEPEAESVGKPVSCVFETDTPSTVFGRTHGLRQCLCNTIQAALHLPGESVLVKVNYAADQDALVIRVTNPDGGWSDIAGWFDFDAACEKQLSDDPTRTAPWLYFHIAEQVANKLNGRVRWERDDLLGLDHLSLVVPATVSSTEIPETVQQPVTRLDNVRLLVIDDSTDNQRIIRHFLELAGAEVDIADNGHTGSVMVHSAASHGNAYHAILMDMQMPVLNGYEATKRLRADGCQLPIIAITAYALDGDRNKCLSAGCDEYITKPIKRSELIQVVESQMRQNREPTVVV
jgi:CheY-like chemotaxis protein